MVEMPFENRVVIHDKLINSGFELEALIDVNPKPGLLHSLLNRWSKWFIAATYYGVIMLRHDDVAVAVWAVLGSVLNISLSLALKQIIYQDRPDPEVGSGPGMPSSHTQSISFAVIYIILSVVGWLGLNAFSSILSGIVIVVGLYFGSILYTCLLLISWHHHQEHDNKIETSNMSKFMATDPTTLSHNQSSDRGCRGGHDLFYLMVLRLRSHSSKGI